MIKSINKISFQITLLFISYLVLGLATAILGPSLPILSIQTETNLTGISTLFIGRYFGYIVGVSIFGILYDYHNGSELMICSLIGMFVSILIIPFVNKVWILFGVIAILGVAQSGIDLGGIVLLAKIIKENSSPFINSLHFFFGIGTIIAPLLIYAERFTQNKLFQAYIPILILIIILTVGFMMLKDKKIYNPIKLNNPLSRKKIDSSIIAIGFFYFFYIGAEASFGGLIFSYNLSQAGYSSINPSVTNSLFWASITFGRLLIIPLSSKIKPYKILILSIIISVLSQILLMLVKSNNLLYFGVFSTGIAMSFIFPGMLNYSNQYHSLSGKNTSILMLGANAGAMTFPFITGYLMNTYHYRMLFVIVFFALCFSGLVFIFIRSKHQLISERM